MRGRYFCPVCRVEVTPQTIKTYAFDGSVIEGVYCPACGSILEARRKVVDEPFRDYRVEKGLYVAFEGIDGSGKTTQVEKLVERLEAMNVDVVSVREPWLDASKEILYNYRMDPDAEVYIFAADRIILQREIVLPALRGDKVVVSDRSFYASLAYQSSLGASQEFIWAANRWIKLPDIVFLLDLPVEKALERIKGREALTKYERIEFLEHVRRKFLKIASEVNESRFIVIDATRDIEKIAEEVFNHVIKEIEARGIRRR